MAKSFDTSLLYGDQVRMDQCKCGISCRFQLIFSKNKLKACYIFHIVCQLGLLTDWYGTKCQPCLINDQLREKRPLWMEWSDLKTMKADEPDDVNIPGLSVQYFPISSELALEPSYSVTLS